VAQARIGAVVLARLQRAVVTHPSFVTRAAEVLAATMSGAIVRADDPLTAVSTTPAVDAMARSIVTKTMA